MTATSSTFVTRAVRAARGSASLRVTVPQVIAELLDLGPGDEVRWVVDPRSGAVRIEGRVPAEGAHRPAPAPAETPP
jgi:Antidote-toxin recognition MazE, bacterial antitoxin